MDLKPEVGRRLKLAREAAGMTLEQVCAQVPGLKNNRLSNYEQGSRMLPVYLAKPIAAALGVSAEYLLTITDTPPDPREDRLVRIWRGTDERGREAIFGVAEKESVYGMADCNHTSKAA
jgi:transcriptional regulator with XRE-family HTH domain